MRQGKNALRIRHSRRSRPLTYCMLQACDRAPESSKQLILKHDSGLFVILHGRYINFCHHCLGNVQSVKSQCTHPETAMCETCHIS